MAIRATVTGKNQITIPAVIVRELQLEPGMQLEFELGEERTILVRPVESRAEVARRLQGVLRPYLKPGEDPVADLIRERVEDDDDMGRP
jgi:AbrB family looped-hinge helix DNA binding protein